MEKGTCLDNNCLKFTELDILNTVGCFVYCGKQYKLRTALSYRTDQGRGECYRRHCSPENLLRTECNQKNLNVVQVNKKYAPIWCARNETKLFTIYDPKYTGYWTHACTSLTSVSFAPPHSLLFAVCRLGSRAREAWLKTLNSERSLDIR